VTQGCRRLRELQPAEDLARVSFEDLRFVGGRDRGRVDVAFRVVELVAGLRVDAFDRADELGGEQDVVDRDDAGQEVDAGLVVHAGVEEDVVAHDLGDLGPAVHEPDTAEAAPVIGHGSAAVRDDELQRREVLEEIREHQLREAHRVAVEVVGAGRKHRRVAAAADVHHRRDVELHHLLVERIPPLVAQRR